MPDTAHGRRGLREQYPALIGRCDYVAQILVDDVRDGTAGADGARILAVGAVAISPSSTSQR